jgi:hypothetical protein
MTVPDDIRVRSLPVIGDAEIEGLSDVLIDCVEGGAGVSFLMPMTRAKAQAYPVAGRDALRHHVLLQIAARLRPPPIDLVVSRSRRSRSCR